MQANATSEAAKEAQGDWSALTSPAGSRVSIGELRKEIEEYFTLGVDVKAGDTVVDVGANLGAFSLRCAELCKSDVTILAFEPSPPTFAALRANFDTQSALKATRHKLFSNGLGPHDQAGRELVFYNFRYFPTNSTFDIATKRREFEIFFEDRGRRMKTKLGRVLGGPLEAVVASLPKGKVGWWFARKAMGLEEVKATIDTLDRVLARERIARVDLLKLDVEGMEIDILRGLGPESWPKVMQVVLEVNSRARADEAGAMLRANGLTEITEDRQSTIDNGLDSVLLLAKRPR